MFIKTKLRALLAGALGTLALAGVAPHTAAAAAGDQDIEIVGTSVREGDVAFLTARLGCEAGTFCRIEIWPSPGSASWYDFTSGSLSDAESTHILKRGETRTVVLTIDILRDTLIEGPEEFTVWAASTGYTNTETFRGVWQQDTDYQVRKSATVTIMDQNLYLCRGCWRPVEEAPAEEAPAEEAPVGDVPAEEAPAGDVPAEEAPAEEAPADGDV